MKHVHFCHAEPSLLGRGYISPEELYIKPRQPSPCVPVTIVAEIQQQLDAQLRSCAELQRQLNQEDETQADILDKDKDLMKAHAQCKAQMDENV
ncbi:hypothetical protein IWW56_001210 [Coemansia sp. RSA 2131]|nr:hypothetical protein IWW56_001210 [Coemansia sp. RSA 2131]